jgi:hypothetical protein
VTKFSLQTQRIIDFERRRRIWRFRMGQLPPISEKVKKEIEKDIKDVSGNPQYIGPERAE